MIAATGFSVNYFGSPACSKRRLTVEPALLRHALQRDAIVDQHAVRGDLNYLAPG